MGIINVWRHYTFQRDDNYGKIYIYTFPKGRQVSGPAQVEALIAQNAMISQKLTLWGQGGSEAKLGRMIILPAGKSLLYIQPLYLISTASARIPELKRIIVSHKNIVAMDVLMELAIKDIDTRLTTMLERMEKRYKMLPVKPEKESVKKEPEKESVEKPEKKEPVEKSTI